MTHLPFATMRFMQRPNSRERTRSVPSTRNAPLTASICRPPKRGAPSGDQFECNSRKLGGTSTAGIRRSSGREGKQGETEHAAPVFPHADAAGSPIFLCAFARVQYPEGVAPVRPDQDQRVLPGRHALQCLLDIGCILDAMAIDLKDHISTLE